MATLLAFSFAGYFFAHCIFQVATAGDSARDPVSLSESFLAFVVCLLDVHAFVRLFIYLLYLIALCTYHCFICWLAMAAW